MDYHFPDGLHRGDIHRARVRLQLLAEMGLGWQLRTHEATQQAGVAALKGAIGGTR